MTMRIGIYGGKFDPIHIGHLICAEWTREHFGLDKVLFVTSANPPHKKSGVLDAELRHEMVEAAVEPNCYFEASDIELRREGPSYTLLTVRQLKEEYGDSAELFLMLSAEYLDPENDWRIDRWKGADELLQLVNLMVFPRDDMGVDKIEEWSRDIPQAKIHSLTCPTPPVSSSLIRKRVKNFQSIWYMVTPEIWEIIRDRRHYLEPGVTPPEKYYGRCANPTSQSTTDTGQDTGTKMKETSVAIPSAPLPGANLDAFFAAKRAAMREEFFARMFALGGFIGATDTYKRTMWTAVPDIALAPAAYHLTLRKGLTEAGADDQLLMAGHEAMLAQWFHRPLKRTDIELSRHWSLSRSNVKAFPSELWDSILDSQEGEDIYLPIDIWGFPGGQTFLKGVPALSFEGPGGAISYLEPAMCRYFAPVIQATKARLMKAATDRDAEFGLRAAVNEQANLVLLLARYVGSRAGLTSNDTAEFLYPELFKTIGTIGHEMMCANQSLDKSLAQAEYEMMDRFVSRMGTASLLCDLVDAETIGLENALRVISEHTETSSVGVRVDSGNIEEQCATYFEQMKARGIEPRTIVFEDEVNPETVQRVYAYFTKRTGEKPTMLFPGAGGYWWRSVHRDTVSAAFKRSSTNGNPNLKFSNTPGKESLPGQLRVYAQDDLLVVADASETIDGVPLYVKLVDQGRIVHHESFDDQADRTDLTWGRYRDFVLSDKVAAWKDAYTEKRATEIAAAKKRLTGAKSGGEAKRKKKKVKTT